jgi:competence protein ComEC
VGSWSGSRVLPSAAAAFGVGILSATHFGLSEVGAPGGAALLLIGATVLGLGRLVAARRGPRSRELLRTAGLLEPEPRGFRARVLRAAGIAADSAPSRQPGSVRWARAGAFLLGLGLLGAGWVAVRDAAGPELGSLAGRYVRFGGVAASDLRRFEFGWGLEASVRVALPESSGSSVSARLWLSGQDEVTAIRAGEPVSGTGIVTPLPLDPSGFEEYLGARGVAGIVRVYEVRASGPAPNPALRLANAARDALRRGAFRSLPQREAALLLGLSIGDTEAMDPEVDRDFRATGLGHLLAVSGSNVAMFLAPILAAAAAFGARPRGRFVVGLAAVSFFALLTRWEPSVLRASAMAGLALAGVLAGRPRATGALLGGAVLGVLVVDPGLAASIGFQLSVAATGGLAAMAGPLAARLERVPRPMALAAAATIAAQAAVTPILLLRFGVVPTVTLLANLLAFPAVGAALFGGLAASSTALLSPGLGAIIGEAAALPLSYLISLSDGAARLPLPAVTSSGPVGPVVAGAAVIGWVWRLRTGRRPANRWIAGLAVAVMAWSAVPGAGPPAELTVIFLDVGQGDAAVVRTPEGATVLVDAGPDEEQVAARLAALGIRRIDLAVATHAHADHVEGFPPILARFPVALLIEPGCPGDSPSHHRLMESIRDEDVPVRHPRGGQVLTVGRLVVEVLGPDGCSPVGSEPNDDSIVLRLRYGEATVLFTGDVEVRAQQDLLEDGDPLEAQVLKVPHHGGDTSLDEFFEAVGAEVSVVSTGPNDYGHPHPDVLAALRDASGMVFRTDLAGEVTVRFSEDGLLVESAGD